jgi:uncharacterized protein
MKKSKLKPPKVNRAAIVVRSSPIHGKGVFAKIAIKKGAALIEYEGERISWKEAERRHPHNQMSQITPSTFPWRAAA